MKGNVQSTLSVRAYNVKQNIYFPNKRVHCPSVRTGLFEQRQTKYVFGKYGAVKFEINNQVHAVGLRPLLYITVTIVYNINVLYFINRGRTTGSALSAYSLKIHFPSFLPFFLSFFLSFVRSFVHSFFFAFFLFERQK